MKTLRKMANRSVQTLLVDRSISTVFNKPENAILWWCHIGPEIRSIDNNILLPLKKAIREQMK